MKRPRGLDPSNIPHWIEKTGLHPIDLPEPPPPTDQHMTIGDREVGIVLAWHIGPVVDEVDPKPMSALEQWRRVARALRIHGLEIVDRKDGPT